MNKPVKEETSEIEHVIENGKIRHVRFLYVEIDNIIRHPVYTDFILIESANKKIGLDMFDGYRQGRTYFYRYIKYLD